MGCLFHCFGASKNRKSQRKQKNTVTSGSGDQSHGNCETLQPTDCTKNEVESNIEATTDSNVKNDDQLLDGRIRKKVTFDLNVITYEEVVSSRKIQTFSAESENERDQEKKAEIQSESQSLSEDSSTSSVFTYPPSHRYHNCTTSDDESEDIQLLLSDHSDGNDDGDVLDSSLSPFCQQESSESLFSLSIESRKRVVSASGIDEKEVNSPITVGLNPIARDRSKFVGYVLNPIENLNQWKSVKARSFTTSKVRKKENININLEEESIPLSEEPSFKPSNCRQKPESKGIAVDTSHKPFKLVG